MKILVAVDSFKDCMSSIEVANAVESGLMKSGIEAEIIKLPVSDGGEGFLDSWEIAQKAERVSVISFNPLMKPIESYYLKLADETAIIELAKCSGLDLLTHQERNPLLTSTFGTGVLIRHAIENGAKKVILGIGGSATNDAAMGILFALGCVFYDKDGNTIPPNGKSLENIHSFDTTRMVTQSNNIEFVIACDVNNPFYGKNGAAHVYAKQKGAQQEEIEKLNKGLENFAQTIQKQSKIDIQQIAGAGAAGGVGGGLASLLGAKLVPGAELVFTQLGVENIIQDVDLVITGEGRIDAQTKFSKTPSEIAQLAQKYGKRVIAIAGQVDENAHQLSQIGLKELYSIHQTKVDLQTALQFDYTWERIEKTISLILCGEW
jgi:glycerate kinase